MCRPVDNGSIIFLERKQSSTPITSLFNSCRCRESCRTIAIKSGPCMFNNTTWTSSTRRVAKTGCRLPQSTSSCGTNLSAYCLWTQDFWVALLYDNDPNFLAIYQTLVQVNKFRTSTSRMNFDATWAIFVFLKVSVWSWFGWHITMGLHGTSMCRKH